MGLRSGRYRMRERKKETNREGEKENQTDIERTEIESEAESRDEEGRNVCVCVCTCPQTEREGEIKGGESKRTWTRKLYFTRIVGSVKNLSNNWSLLSYWWVDIKWQALFIYRHEWVSEMVYIRISTQTQHVPSARWTCAIHHSVTYYEHKTSK